MNSAIEMKPVFMEPVLLENKGYLTGHYRGRDLYTALQPIFSLAHKRIVGYEALLRVKNSLGKPVSPADFFRNLRNPCELARLEDLCRHLHTHNFQTIGDDVNWLFLNVSPQSVMDGNFYGRSFSEMLQWYDMPAQRVVIEIVEHSASESRQLQEAVEHYKKMGCLIAIDDFGAGHSNFDRIWMLKPDIVKLDRSFVVKAATQKAIRDMLPGIISLLHQSGALVLLEGVETREQAMMAIEGEADFVQGYYFGRPGTDLESAGQHAPDFDSLFTDYKISYCREQQKINRLFSRYNKLFTQVVEGLRDGLPLIEASRCLIEDEKVVRCYEIGTDGVQVGNTMVSQRFMGTEDCRYRPLDDARSADWFRRHYLRRAVLHPEQLQITRPYLSITGAHMCVTLSMKFAGPCRDSVLCCDLSV